MITPKFCKIPQSNKEVFLKVYLCCKKGNRFIENGVIL